MRTIWIHLLGVRIETDNSVPFSSGAPVYIHYSLNLYMWPNSNSIWRKNFISNILIRAISLVLFKLKWKNILCIQWKFQWNQQQNTFNLAQVKTFRNSDCLLRSSGVVLKEKKSMSRRHAKLLCSDVTNLNSDTISTLFFARSLHSFCTIFVLSLCPYNKFIEICYECEQFDFSKNTRTRQQFVVHNFNTFLCNHNYSTQFKVVWMIRKSH